MHLVFVNVPSLQRELNLCNIVWFTCAGVSVIHFYQSGFITVTMAVFLYFKYRLTQCGQLGSFNHFVLHMHAIAN